ncbi:MAG: hypothetical protein WC683_06915 [bacterium]
MGEHWTANELRAYARAIRLAPQQRAQIEVNRRRRVDRLLERLHPTLPAKAAPEAPREGGRT